MFITSAKPATMSNVSAVAFVLALALLAVFHCERDTNFILLQYQLKTHLAVVALHQPDHSSLRLS